MSNIDEIKPLVDALDFIKFTDRSIGNKFTIALKALQIDLQEAEGGPYEPSTEAEQALGELAAEIADALEQLEEEDEIKEVVVEAEKEDEEEKIIDEVLSEEEKEELEDLSDAADDPLLDDDVLENERIEVIKEPEN